jgi:hypothetical protein
VLIVPKQGMKRPNIEEVNKEVKKDKNEIPPVPEIQGKAKHGHTRVNNKT